MGDVTEEEYNEFYKGISKDYLDPLAYTHFNAEGEIEFKSILFLPKKAPFDMMDNYHTKKSEVKLYVRRVLVAEKFEELLPRYLNFVRGVVDSDDLPLNVSREQLQQNKIMKVISKKLVRKVLELMKKLAKEDDSGDDDDEEKDDEEKDEKEDKLKETAKKYSQFIQFPIYVKVKKEVDADAEEDDDDDKEEEEEKKPKKKTVYEWEQVNTQKAIWLRAKEDVTEEEYNEFYKSISKDYLDPLAYTHFNAEGEIEFKS